MQETPKREQDEEKGPVVEPQLSADENDRPYYYDDAHGYKTYSPDLEDEESDEEPASNWSPFDPRQ